MALDTPLGFGRDVGVTAGERQEGAVSSITPPRTQGRRRRHWRSKARLVKNSSSTIKHGTQQRGSSRRRRCCLCRSLNRPASQKQAVQGRARTHSQGRARALLRRLAHGGLPRRLDPSDVLAAVEPERPGEGDRSHEAASLRTPPRRPPRRPGGRRHAAAPRAVRVLPRVEARAEDNSSSRLQRAHMQSGQKPTRACATGLEIPRENSRAGGTAGRRRISSRCSRGSCARAPGAAR